MSKVCILGVLKMRLRNSAKLYTFDVSAFKSVQTLSSGLNARTLDTSISKLFMSQDEVFNFWNVTFQFPHDQMVFEKEQKLLKHCYNQKKKRKNNYKRIDSCSTKTKRQKDIFQIVPSKDKNQQENRKTFQQGQNS